MEDSHFWQYTIFAIVMLHLVAGFGYLMVKLSPKKGDKDDENKEDA